MADVHNKEIRSYNMSRIRSNNTKIEILLSKALWNRGYRYKRNDSSIIGKPDFVFKKIKLVIFCDSEFWHGKDWETQQKRIGTNKDFWISKIQNNKDRDRRINERLANSGWVVLRFWETDLKKNLDYCIFITSSVISYLKLVPYNNLKNLR